MQGFRHLRIVAEQLHGEDSRRDQPLCRHPRLPLPRLPPHLRLYPYVIAASRKPEDLPGAAALACRNTSSPPMSGYVLDPGGGFGLSPCRCVTWVRGGYEDPGAGGEDRAVWLPADVRLGRGLPAGCHHFLRPGRFDGYAGCRDRPPRAVLLRGWWPPRMSAACGRTRSKPASEWYGRTRIFPDHAPARHPPRPGGAGYPCLRVGALAKAFEAGEGGVAMAKLSNTRPPPRSRCPSSRNSWRVARALMGEDFWSYGLGAEPPCAGGLPAGLHHAQGLSASPACGRRNCSTPPRSKASRFETYSALMLAVFTTRSHLFISFTRKAPNSAGLMRRTSAPSAANCF